MSDGLKDLMKSAFLDYEAAGVDGSEGARAMRDGLARIEELEDKLAKAALALQICCNFMEYGTWPDRDPVVLAQTTLAKLKGQDDE